MKYTIILFIGLIVVSCDPHSAFTECSYQYPINVIGLNDTINTTDTIWIENDLDARLCLNEGVYTNGEGYEIPRFDKLEKDSFVYFAPFVFGFYDSIRNQDNLLFYRIKWNYEKGRYKSRYGIVFPEPGIFILSNTGSRLENGKDGSISILGYFNVQSNNKYLISDSIKAPKPEPEYDKPFKYGLYFIKVVE